MQLYVDHAWRNNLYHIFIARDKNFCRENVHAHSNMLAADALRVSRRKFRTKTDKK